MATRIDRAPDLKSARSFIRTAELPPKPAVTFGIDTGLPDATFETAKSQAVVVGSDVISFADGVDEETRKAISDCSLLAQLVAKKKVPDPQEIYDWYQAYFDVLVNIGWVIQENGFTEYVEEGQGFEVHEAILNVATVLLGPVPGALAIVTATLNSLKSMNAGSPWITIFSRESQHAKAARFQLTLVRNDPAHGVMVELMAFGVKAKKTITQVLFFKFKESNAELRRNLGKVSLNSEALAALRPDIRNKVLAFQKSYISSLPDLGV